MSDPITNQEIRDYIEANSGVSDDLKIHEKFGTALGMLQRAIALLEDHQRGGSFAKEDTKTFLNRIRPVDDTKQTLMESMVKTGAPPMPVALKTDLCGEVAS